MKNNYTPQFYLAMAEGVSRSSKVILGMLYKFYRPLSVVDIGCGQGAWLREAEALGSLKLKGYDGNWVDKDALLSKNIDFTAVDLAKNDLLLKEKYDLCISVEVAEHLPETSAAGFVRLLCGASDVIVFSAAIKYQGGTDHVNEQRQSYWIKLFEANGYDCLDLFRPAIWENSGVKLWYRQNLFLFLNRGAELAKNPGLRNTAAPIANVVHYEYYESVCKQIENPTLRFGLGCIKRYLLNQWAALSGKRQ